jgi:hypothetical protein
MGREKMGREKREKFLAIYILIAEYFFLKFQRDHSWLCIINPSGLILSNTKSFYYISLKGYNLHNLGYSPWKQEGLLIEIFSPFQFSLFSLLSSCFLSFKTLYLN